MKFSGFDNNNLEENNIEYAICLSDGGSQKEKSCIVRVKVESNCIVWAHIN